MSLSLKVEVAFNAGFATAAGSRTWTDISSYVELQDGIDISFGRRDEFSNADANTLSLTLDNSDGRFTPERSSSPYYPNVKLYRPIRVTATLPDSSTSVRFLGYVTQWPTEWQGGEDGYATLNLTASSRMSRLGTATALRSMLEEEVLLDAPIAYYTLGEASGLTSASDSSGMGQDPVLSVGSGTAVDFGTATGPGTDGLTAATFAGGKFLASAYAGPAASTAECWFIRSGIPSSAAESLLYVNGSGLWTFSLVQTTGKVSCGGVISSSANLCDGKWHHVVYVDDGVASRKLYVDGVLDATAAVGFGMTLSAPSIAGNNAGNPYNENPLTGSLAHVAIYPQALTATRIASHYQVGIGVLESTGQRWTRVAGYAGVAATEVSAGGAAVTVGAQNTTGKTVLDALRDVESTEAGILYDSRDGFLTLAPRNARYSAAPSFTLDASAQHIGSDFRPTYDQTGVLNDVTATGPTASARYMSASSITDYGQASQSIDTLATDPDEPMMLAGWEVNTHDQPVTRVGTLTVDVLPFGLGGPGPSAMDLAAVSVGWCFSASNLPTQAASSSASYFVEGYTEKFNVESWQITFNVSPTAPYLNTWVLDSGTRSQLDSTTILAL